MKLQNVILSGAAAVALTLVQGLAFSGSAAADPEAKVLICHIPPGNPANAHEIIVAESAVNAHLDHGDTLGPCQLPPELPPPPVG
jgi:hypothetical protein